MNQILVCELGEFTVSRVAVMIKKKVYKAFKQDLANNKHSINADYYFLKSI